MKREKIHNKWMAVYFGSYTEENFETRSSLNFPFKQFITPQSVISSCFRSPASEEKTRRRGRRSRDSREARTRYIGLILDNRHSDADCNCVRHVSESLSLSPNQPQLSSADRSPVDPGGHGGGHPHQVSSLSPGGLLASHSPQHQPQPPRYSPHADLPSPFSPHQG